LNIIESGELRLVALAFQHKTATQQIDIYFRYIGKLAPEAVA
jgi:hypothetical protein